MADLGQSSPDREDGPAPSWRADLCLMLRLGWPNSVNMVLTFLPGLLMFSFLADANEIAGAGMGFMFSNVTGFSMVIGFGAGKEPLISQAFGARNFKRCGDILQRQLAIHAVILLFVTAIWIKTEDILILCKQPSAVAALAGRFVLWRVAALPSLALKEDLTGFLTAQRVMILPMVASISASIVNVLGFMFLIPKVGFIGAPLAYTLANNMQALGLMLFSPCVLPETAAWPSWSMQTAFSGWGEILKLALPGGILMLCEWWGWESNLFFAGLLCEDSVAGCVDLDTFPIVANTMVVGFMPNFGVAMAAIALIGNALGANDPSRARRFAYMSLVVAAIMGGSIAFILVLLRGSWGLLFTDDPEVVELTSRVLPTIAAYIFWDNLGPGSLVNILRGMSVVVLPAIINFVAFYLIGIPFGLWLTFNRSHEHWGIIGLWSGLVLAMFVLVASLMLYLCCRVNWHSLAELAQRTALEGEQKVGVVQDAAKLKSKPNTVGKRSYDAVAREDSNVDVLPEEGILAASPNKLSGA